MKDLNAEEFNAIPETMREHFAEVEDNGAKVYRSKVVMAQAETLAKYKTKAAELDTLKSEYATKAEQAEAARIQALKEKGDFEELYKVESTKSAETLERLRKKDEALSNKAKQSLINGLKNLFTDDGEDAGLDMLESMISFDVESEKYVFSDKGTKLNVDENGFREYVENHKRFATVVKAKSSIGGKGQNAGNATNDLNGNSAKAEEAKKKGDLTGFLNASIKN